MEASTTHLSVALMTAIAPNIARNTTDSSIQEMKMITTNSTSKVLLRNGFTCSRNF